MCVYVIKKNNRGHGCTERYRRWYYRQFVNTENRDKIDVYAIIKRAPFPRLARYWNHSSFLRVWLVYIFHLVKYRPIKGQRLSPPWIIDQSNAENSYGARSNGPAGMVRVWWQQIYRICRAKYVTNNNGYGTGVYAENPKTPNDY